MTSRRRRRPRIGPATRPPARRNAASPPRERAPVQQQRGRPRARARPAARRRTARPRRCFPRRRAARPARRRRGRAAPRSATASPVAARCMSAPSGRRAISASSAARTSRPLDAVHTSLPPLGDPQCFASSDSAITVAAAIPPSCDSDTCQRVTPSDAARAATVPRTTSEGRPASSVSTSASVQCMPPPAPSALASASFAANRAASDSARARLAGRRHQLGRGEQPRASDGVRCSASANRATGTTSMPTPTIMAAASADAVAARGWLRRAGA